MHLRDRTILVTGGARGIGRELTRQFVAEGAHVVAVGRDAAQLAQLEAQHPGQVSGWVADLSDPAETDALIAELPIRHPRLSVLVNNAGAQTLTDFVGGDAQAFRPALRSEISLNFDAVVALSTGLLKHLQRRPSAIVNVTSGLALAPKTSSPVYCATKAAVRSFTKSLRYQCEDAAPQVRVVEAIMALVDTDMTAGRGGPRKISAERAAAEIVAGLKAGQTEIYVERAKLLRTLMRVAPEVGERIMRRG